MAYHGLGRGLDAERFGLQLFAQRVPQLLLCYTCSKNFGLYRDRVGMLLVLAQDAHQQSHCRKAAYAASHSALLYAAGTRREFGEKNTAR